MRPLVAAMAPAAPWPTIADCPRLMLDLTTFLQDVPSALEVLGAELRHALKRLCTRLLPAYAVFFNATYNYPMAACRPARDQTIRRATNPPRMQDYMLWCARQHDLVRAKDTHESQDPGVPDTQA